MVGRQRPHLNAAGRSRLPAWRGEAENTLLARALTSSREWEGNGISHDARKDGEVTADAGAHVLISQRWQVSADSVIQQVQPIKCV